jgi:hypothetical protein
LSSHEGVTAAFARGPRARASAIKVLSITSRRPCWRSSSCFWLGQSLGQCRAGGALAGAFAARLVCFEPERLKVMVPMAGVLTCNCMTTFA